MLFILKFAVPLKTASKMSRVWLALLLLGAIALALEDAKVCASLVDNSAGGDDTSSDFMSPSGSGNSDDDTPTASPPTSVEDGSHDNDTHMPVTTLFPAPASKDGDKKDDDFFSYTDLPDVKFHFPTDGPVPPNWVGPSIGDFADTACYRKSHKQNSQAGCPDGYNASGHRCWAQCPISYPVQCLAECIPQNNDCVMEVMAKVSNLGYVALNVATAGVLNAIYKSFKGVKTGLMCAFNVFNIAEGISRFIQTRQMLAPNGTKEQILSAVFQTDLFLVDLPVALTACMGYEVPRYAYFADAVVTGAETIVKQLMINHNLIMSSSDAFLAFFRNTTAGKSTRDLDAKTVANLTAMIESGTKCGFELKRLTDRVIIQVGDIREADPFATNEDIRTAMGKSSIVLKDVPTVTNNCMGELLKAKKPYVAYQTRDTLRKTFGVIIDQLIEKSTTDMGKADYWVTTANFGLLGLSALDPTGIAFLTYNYVQPVCGPTEFIGDIDDGSLADALGLATKDEAFQGSEGTWTKKGDGVVKIEFVSTDNKDVKVVVHSGGKKFDTVEVASGETVTWTSTVEELQDKTMYLDRWRPGFLGLPGNGGGSLLLWVPRASEGGHLDMTVKISKS